jgi:hypothetical protein
MSMEPPEFATHAMTLASTFVAQVFADSVFSNTEAASAAAGIAKEGDRDAASDAERTLLLERDFRGHLESQILKNGALKGDPSPWTQHVRQYCRITDVDMVAGLAAASEAWRATVETWTEFPLNQVKAKVLKESKVDAVLFACMQSIVHDLVFEKPWIYMSECLTAAQRAEALRELDAATMRSLVDSQVRVTYGGDARHAREDAVRQLMRCLMRTPPALALPLVRKPEPESVHSDSDSEPGGDSASDDSESDGGTASVAASEPGDDVAPDLDTFDADSADDGSQSESDGGSDSSGTLVGFDISDADRQEFFAPLKDLGLRLGPRSDTPPRLKGLFRSARRSLSAPFFRPTR